MIQREEKQEWRRASARTSGWRERARSQSWCRAAWVSSRRGGSEATRLAVVKFRKDVFKEDNPAGGVGPETWKKLDERAGAKPAGTPGNRPSLWLGDSGPAVLLVQRILNITQTGVFDERTRLEVVQFRKVVFKEENPAGGVGPERGRSSTMIGASQAKTGLCGGWHPCSPPGQARCPTPRPPPAAGEINIALDLEALPRTMSRRSAPRSARRLQFSGGDGKRWSYGFYNNPADPPGTPDPSQHPKVMGSSTPITSTMRASTSGRRARSPRRATRKRSRWRRGCAGLPRRRPEGLQLTTFAAKIVEVAGGSVPNYQGKIGGTGGVTADNPYAFSESLNKDVPTRTPTDANQIHDWLQPRSYDDTGSSRRARRAAHREVLKGWVRDNDSSRSNGCAGG